MNPLNSFKDQWAGQYSY